MPVEHSPILPMPNLGAWAESQQRVASQPLDLCPEFPSIAARHEAFWRCEPGPALLLGSAPKPGTGSISKHLELVEDTEAWFAARRQAPYLMEPSPDFFPYLRADFGPVMLTGLLGAAVEFGSETSWYPEFIADDWRNAPDWSITNQRWWRALERMLERVAQAAAGKYLMGTPSLGGGADVMLNMRGSAKLCLDLIDQRSQFQPAMDAIYHSWHRAFSLLWDSAARYNAGLVHWLTLWSNQPYYVAECDFNYLISPRDFQELFLPDIVRRAKTVGRAIFHLDGPGAARHIDALLDEPAITAIQYVTGAGNSGFKKLEMLKRIQTRGKPLQVTLYDPEEVVALARELQPKGLAFLIDFASPDQMMQVYRQLQQN